MLWFNFLLHLLTFAPFQIRIWVSPFQIRIWNGDTFISAALFYSFGQMQGTEVGTLTGNILILWYTRRQNPNTCDWSCARLILKSQFKQRPWSLEKVLARRRVNRSDVAGLSGSYVKLVRDIMFVSLRSLWNPNWSNCVMWSVISLAGEGVEKLAA